MTYRQVVEKAVLQYMHANNFSGRSPIYIRQITDDLSQCISFTKEKYNFTPHFCLRAKTRVVSHSLNEILFAITSGVVDNRQMDIGPVSHIHRRKKIETDNTLICCEFIEERPMEDNMADFDKMMKTDVQFIFDTYNTQKSIYTCSAHEEIFPFNPGNAPGLIYYGPLGYFFDGQFSKAFRLIDRWVAVQEMNMREFGVNEESTECIKAFKNMRSNLQKWIKERRQFKVDDGYLPNYTEVNKNPFNKISLLITRLLPHYINFIIRELETMQLSRLAIFDDSEDYFSQKKSPYNPHVNIITIKKKPQIVIKIQRLLRSIFRMK